MTTTLVALMFAGPNGAGKTTTAMTLFRDTLRSVDFVNADVIAQGLSGGDPDSVALQAGGIMLRRLYQLVEEGKSLAFETTGASRSFAPWLRSLKAAGYEFRLTFFWLNDPSVAVARVAERVRMGGHHVPEETIRRRYDRGLCNFFSLYLPIANTWQLVDNNDVGAPRIIAQGGEALETVVQDVTLWTELKARYGP